MFFAKIYGPPSVPQDLNFMPLSLWELSRHPGIPAKEGVAFSGPAGHFHWSHDNLMIRFISIDMVWRCGEGSGYHVRYRGCKIFWFLWPLIFFARRSDSHNCWYDPQRNNPLSFPIGVAHPGFHPYKAVGGSRSPRHSQLLRVVKSTWFQHWTIIKNLGGDSPGLQKLDVSAWTGQHISMSHSQWLCLAAEDLAMVQIMLSHDKNRLKQVRFRILHVKMTAK